jgi:hypothetical protein
VGNCEVTPQSVWPIANSLTKRDGPKVPTAVHGHLGITYHHNEEVKEIADYLEDRFTSHDLCDKTMRDGKRIRFQALLVSLDDTALGEVGALNKHTRRLAKFIEIETRLCTWRYSKWMPQASSKKATGKSDTFSLCIRHHRFAKPWKVTAIITLPKLGKGPTFPLNLHPIRASTGKQFEKVFV